MQIERTTRFVGPNLFADVPVLHFRITGKTPLPARALGAASSEALRQLLPSITADESACAASAAFFASAESDRSLALAHAIEHVAIALQHLAGCVLRCVRGQGSDRIGRRSAIVAYEEPGVAEAAVALAGEIVERLIEHEAIAASPADVADESRPEPVAGLAPQIQAFLRVAARGLLPVQDRSFVRAARDRDVPTRRIAGRMIQLGQGCYQQRVSATKTTRTNVVSNDLAANKDFARRILAGLGLPIPRFERVYRQKQAVEAARRIGYPVVVKPNQGNMGQAVSVGMRTDREVRAAYKRAREIDRSVLVEELVEGDDYRILVVDGVYCAASKRTPGHVVGDGTSTVEQLVEILNQDPRRGRGPRSPWTRLELDEQADRLLADRKMTRTSIPAKDETIFLRRNANTSDGGTAMDVTDDVHPDNREIAVRAARSIGLDIAGVDFLTKDITRSMWRTGGKICEINSRPGLRKHMWPANGPPRDIMTPIVDMLYPPGQPSRIPVVAVLGIDKTAGRSAARALAGVLRSSGRHVGLALRHRVYLDGRKLPGERLSAPDAARLILFDPAVEIAVLEWTVNDVVRDGLGCDVIDLALIVEAADPDGDAAIGTRAGDALRLVARTTRGALLLSDRSGAHEALAAESSPVERVVVDPTQAEPPEAGRAAETVAGLELVIAAARRLGVSSSRIRKALTRRAVKAASGNARGPQAVAGESSDDSVGKTGGRSTSPVSRS